MSAATQVDSGDSVGEKRTVFLVDDHPIVRQGLARMIASEPDLAVCGEAADPPTAIDKISKLKPSLAIIDLSLGSGDGIDLIKSIRAQDPSLPVLVLTMHEESFYAERALRAGAMGFLTKSEASEHVITAVRRLLNGEMYVSDCVSPRLMKRLITGQPDEEGLSISRLSDRELQVFTLIGQGLGTQEIADELSLSVKTIETYRAHVKKKLDIKDARGLIQYAVRWVLSRERG